MATPWAWHLLATRLHPQNSTFPHLGPTHLRTRSTLANVGLPSWFPMLCLPGDKLFQSKDVEKHIAFLQQCMLSMEQSRHREEAQTVAMARLTSAGCRTNRSWHIAAAVTHPTGSDFVRRSKLVAKPHVAEQRKLTRTQVLLLQSLWTPVELPHHSNNHTPWPKPSRPPLSSADNAPAFNSHWPGSPSARGTTEATANWLQQPRAGHQWDPCQPCRSKI